MKFFKPPLSILTTLFVVGRFVLAGPGGYVALTNGSPYDWKLTYSHSYHMNWKPVSIVPAGTSIEQYAEYWYQWGDNGDCGAEATYVLLGSPQPASFTLQARQSHGKRFQIQYHETLSSLNNPQHSLIDLGFIYHGSVLFILSGNGEEPYISSNPPIEWMQATFSTIKSKSLREVSLVASHDSGMSELTRFYGGVDHNTKTQSVHIYGQLKFGARYLDIRPVHRKGKFSTGHFSRFGWEQFGAMGRTIENVINDINRFNRDYPGELIILDISHELDDERRWRNALSDAEWQRLYTLFEKINDPWKTWYTTVPDDITTLPLCNFIQPGSKSSVVIRLPDYAPIPDGSTLTKKQNTTLMLAAFDRSASVLSDLKLQPAIKPAFIEPPTNNSSLTSHLFVFATQFPHFGIWSNTQSPAKLSADQLTKMAYYRDPASVAQP